MDTQPVTSEEQRSSSLSREDLTLRQCLQLTLGQAPTEPLEILFGLGFSLWGAWIMLPWWQVTSLNPSTYRILLSVVKDEFILGGICCAVGGNLISAMQRDDKRARYFTASAFTSVCGVFTVCFLFSDYRSPAFLWWGLFTASGWWMMLRTKERYFAWRETRKKSTKRPTSSAS